MNVVMDLRANGECVRYAEVLRRLPVGSLRSLVLVKKAYKEVIPDELGAADALGWV